MLSLPSSSSHKQCALRNLSQHGISIGRNRITWIVFATVFATSTFAVIRTHNVTSSVFESKLSNTFHSEDTNRYDSSTTHTRTVPLLSLSSFTLPRNDEYDRLIDLLVETHPEDCQGKERLLEVLARATGTAAHMTHTDCQRLPTWKEIVDLYGPNPIIHGLETCQTYREHLKRQRDGYLSIPDSFPQNATHPSLDLEPQPRVDGLFNSGTNALAAMFQLNIKFINATKPGNKRTHVGYNLGGGKHFPPRRELYASDPSIAARRWNELPVVIVRDPFRWMQSMCTKGYSASWDKGVEGHCPNLVPTAEERAQPQYANLTTFKVTVDVNKDVYSGYYEYHDSLIDLWSSWYRAYLYADFPRLIIRFEDILYHAEEVMFRVRECVGLSNDSSFSFKYATERSKPLSSSANFSSALAKYGHSAGRGDGLAREDKDYLQNTIYTDLMKLFHYSTLSASIEETSEANAANASIR